MQLNNYYAAVEVLNHNLSQMFLRFHHKCALFTMTYLSMLGEGSGGGGVGWGLRADGSMVCQLDSRSIDPQWSPS